MLKINKESEAVPQSIGSKLFAGDHFELYFSSAEVKVLADFK
jgi:hypothetical protein